MRAKDILRYLDMADLAYVEEASDFNLLLYRKRRKRTRTALAACLVLVVLAGVFLTKPALYAWETRNTVTSWPSASISFPGFASKPSSPIYVSAEMPDRKKFSADTPFTLSVGMGQVSDYEYATLSVKAHGFEITDKDGNTVTDRYVRTLSNFNSGDYGMVYRNGKPTSPVTGCQYLEDFTFRFTGSENTTGWGVIEFSLQSRNENSSMGDTVTVYYTIQSGVLKLTHKNPVRDGNQNGSLGAVLDDSATKPKTVELSHEGYNMTVTVTDPFLTRGEAWQNKIDISGIPLLSDFMVALCPKDRDAGDMIRLMVPSTFSSMHDFVIPADAPLGSYDLVVIWYGSDADDEEDLPRWVFEDFVTVTEPGTVTLSKEDISIRIHMRQSALYPGILREDDFELRALYIPTQNDYPTDGFTAELVYAETLRQKDYSFFIQKPAEQSADGFAYYFVPSVPEDAPIGSYDLRVTDPATGFVWMFENMAMVLPEPPKEDPDFGTPPPYEDLSCAVTAGKDTFLQGESIMDAFAITLMQYGKDVSFFCSAELVYAEDGGQFCTVTVKESPYSSVASVLYIPTDAPVGGYDLVVTDQRYGYTWRFNHIIEVITNPDAPKFGLNTNIEDKLTISRTSEEIYTFVAEVENLGMPITMTVTPQTEPCPEATLTFAEAPADSGELFEIPLVSVSTPYFEPYEWTWQTGATVTRIFELMLTPDTPCGLYDLILYYGDCMQVFEGVVEVVP